MREIHVLITTALPCLAHPRPRTGQAAAAAAAAMLRRRRIMGRRCGVMR
jgi:hypothetical protein